MSHPHYLLAKKNSVIGDENGRILLGLVNELLKSQTRCKLKENINDAIVEVYKNQVDQNAFHFISSVISTMLNKFVHSLGYCFVDEKNKPSPS